MSDGGGDAKVFDQSFGSEGPRLVMTLDWGGFDLVMGRLSAAIQGRPEEVQRLRDWIVRAKEGVEQIGIVRVTSIDGPWVMLELTPSQDLLDCLAEAEAAR